MVQLNRSMMERYEIADRRPQTLRAVIFGADRLMLGAVARMLDLANESGADLGAACVTGKAASLNAQDGMFTMLIRGETLDGQATREERVVQSVLLAVDPRADEKKYLALGLLPELEYLFVDAEADEVKSLLLAQLLYARFCGGMAAPELLLVTQFPRQQTPDELIGALCRLSAAWDGASDFCTWLHGMDARTLFCDSLSGELSPAETAQAQHQMNYRDDFLAWGEPRLACMLDGAVPERLQAVCTGGDCALALNRKARVFDAAVFLCTAAGYLCGKSSFAEVMKDEALRSWIGRAFFDEILPSLRASREEIAPAVISTFERLENPMNDMPLLDVGRNCMLYFRDSILPSMRAYAEENFEAPAKLAFGLAAAIMLCAGARANEAGEYEVLRGDERAVLHDDPEILAAFSQLSHDMPAETLAYAALADRSVWGDDLREIDGLEMRVAYDLSAIQRIGFRECLKHRLQEWNA